MTHIILRELIEYLLERRAGYTLPNYYIDDWEADVLALSQLGYTTEYEIKVSRADFKKDFDKTKTRYNRKERKRITKIKHDEIKVGNRTNKFYFVTPPGLLKEAELPLHAGLIEIDPSGRGLSSVKVIRQAKWLHKEKVQPKIYSDIMDKFYERYIFQYYLPKLKIINRKTQIRLARLSAPAVPISLIN